MCIVHVIDLFVDIYDVMLVHTLRWRLLCSVYCWSRYMLCVNLLLFLDDHYGIPIMMTMYLSVSPLTNRFINRMAVVVLGLLISFVRFGSLKTKH